MLRGLGLQANRTDSVDWSMPTGFEVHLRPELVRKYVYEVTPSADRPYPDAKVGLVAWRKTGRLKVRKVMTSACAAIIHSIDGCLAQLMLAGAMFPLITTHDAFTCHAANVEKMRDLFLEEMAVLHQFFQPYAVIQRDVGGVITTGLLADPELEQRAMAVVHLASQTQEHPDSIG